MSVSIAPAPLSLSDVLIDGELDLARYCMCKRKDRIKEFQNNSLNHLIRKREHANQDKDIKKKRKFKHRKQRNYSWMRDSDGSLRPCKPCDSTWHELCIETPPTTIHELTLFRRRFRVPHEFFLELLSDIKKHELFSRWLNCDATKSPPSNIALLLLGALRYIGRAFAFDDIEESTAMSREVMRSFFMSFWNMEALFCAKNM